MQAGLQNAVEAALDSAVVASRSLGGGDVAMSFAVDLADGRRVFAKTHADPPPGFFSTEAVGLDWLGQSGSVRVPQVLAVSDGPEVPLLVLEWIAPGTPRGFTEVELGRELATLHEGTWPTFGRPDRRSTGSRGLPNEPCRSWADFFATQRLLPLARLAAETAALPSQVCADLESIANRLEDLGGPPEGPSLLHGDLWAGNRLVDSAGESWLIDAAAHGGHREFDLAMMRLFGGFGDDCFAAYEDVYPLASGWQERIELHQIAPLVVHAIKFGGSYVPAATAVISRYV